MTRGYVPAAVVMVWAPAAASAATSRLTSAWAGTEGRKGGERGRVDTEVRFGGALRERGARLAKVRRRVQGAVGRWERSRVGGGVLAAVGFWLWGVVVPFFLDH